MLFTVILIIFMVICSQINGCPSQRPCTTPNGTYGSCVPAKFCPSIDRLRGANLTPEELEFAKRSICGLNLENSKLFCCDNNEVRNDGQHVIYRQDNSENQSPISIRVEEESQYSAEPVISSQATTTAKPLEPVFCRTPNGEKSQCVSIYQCAILLNSVLSVNNTEDQKRYLKESVCSFDQSEKPLVCCGSDTNFVQSNNGEIRSHARQNSLIPVGSCGMQGDEIEEQTPVPAIKLRHAKNNQLMNFTLPNRIFGGVNSELTEFPWMALLSYETHSGQKMFGCGGSLISSRYVLTAAHCVSERTLEKSANQLRGVRLGEWDYSTKGRDCITADGRTQCNEDEVNVGIERIYLHPGYLEGSKEKYHDIALIRLDRNVKFTKYIRPICLPKTDDYVMPGDRLTIAGWGLVNYDAETTVKQKVDVPAVSRSQCSIMFENSRRLTQIGPGQFCAGGEAGKDACVGDSGAPLMRKPKTNSSSSQWTIEGVVSFGSGCGLVNHYGVYTKVSEYTGWIYDSIVP